MIQMQTNLDVADNSGARRVMCIKVHGGAKRRYAHVGDHHRGVGERTIPRGRVEEGRRHEGGRRAHRQAIRRADGSVIRSTRTRPS